MSLLRDYEESQTIQEILEQDERFEIIGRPLADDQYRYIVRAKHKESGKEVVIKIPLTDEARRQCTTPYNLIKEAHDVKERAKKSDKLQVELNAIDLKGKLNKLYKDDHGDSNQFDKLIQMFQVNIQVKNEEAIDITPEKENSD